MCCFLLESIVFFYKKVVYFSCSIKGTTMKNKFKTLASLAILFGVLFTFSSNIANADTTTTAAPVTMKVAIVDIPQVVAQSKQVQSLKDEQAKKLKELTTWIETAKADISKQSTPAGKEKLTKKYDAEFAKKRELNAQDYAKKLTAIDQSITAAITNYAKSKGYSLVLTKSTVLYGGDDITAEVMKVVK